MGFGDFKKKEGLLVFNVYLVDKSYIEGLVYFYSFFYFELNIFERKGGWGCIVFFMFSFLSKSSIILDMYVIYWKFFCLRFVIVLKYFDM